MHFFYDAQSRPAMVDFNGALYSYIHNLQGDVVGIVDSAGSLVVEYKYDAWGKPTLVRTLTTAYEALAELNPFRYRGYVYDEEMGLYYLRSRYYLSSMNRFISRDDRIAYLGNKSIASGLFAYCRNSPINNFDPSGHFALLTGLLVGAIAGVIAGVAVTGLASHAATQTSAQTSAQTSTPQGQGRIKYGVPVYRQGNYSLCGLFCQVMVESFRSGEILTQEAATARVIELAKQINADQESWNTGTWPSNLGDCVEIDSINTLYLVLEEHGPLYAYYGGIGKGAHMVVVTGVDTEIGVVYTNNPWGFAAEQTFEEFQTIFAGGSDTMPYAACYLIE